VRKNVLNSYCANLTEKPTLLPGSQISHLDRLFSLHTRTFNPNTYRLLKFFETILIMTMFNTKKLCTEKYATKQYLLLHILG